jgi:hypothetical protein
MRDAYTCAHEELPYHTNVALSALFALRQALLQATCAEIPGMGMVHHGGHCILRSFEQGGCAQSHCQAKYQQ